MTLPFRKTSLWFRRLTSLRTILFFVLFTLMMAYSLTLTNWFIDQANRILLRHEITDLVDESELLLSRKIDSVIQMGREDLLAAAASSTFRQCVRLNSELGGEAASETSLDALRREWRELMAMRASPGYAPVPGNENCDQGSADYLLQMAWFDEQWKPLAEAGISSVGEGSNRVGIKVNTENHKKALKTILESGAFQNASTNRMLVTGVSLDAGDVAWQDSEGNVYPLPVIRLAMPITNIRGKASGWLVVTLGLRQTFLELRALPRHVAFLFDQNWNLLMHPALDPRDFTTERAAELKESSVYLQQFIKAYEDERNKLKEGVGKHFVFRRTPDQARGDIKTFTYPDVTKEDSTLSMRPTVWYLLQAPLTDKFTEDLRKSIQDDGEFVGLKLDAIVRKVACMNSQYRSEGGGFLDNQVVLPGIIATPERRIDLARVPAPLTIRATRQSDLEELRDLFDSEGISNRSDSEIIPMDSFFFTHFALPLRPDGATGDGKDPRDPWIRLVTCVSREEMIHDIISQQRYWKTISAMMAAGIATAGVVVVYWFTRPLKSITHAVEAFGEGRPNAEPLPVHAMGEVGSLARAFGVMMGQIDSQNAELARANDELEAKVALRTAELRVENRAKEIQKQVAENARVEVIRKNEELESSLERERMARQAQDGLFRNTSHELRTPLAVIGGYAEDMVQSLDERGVADLAADARIVLDYQKNMLDLVDQLLDYAKIASGNLLPDIAPFSLNDLIRRLLPIDRLMSKNGNTLKREFTSKPLVLRSDLKRIGQIVLNLVSNAAKFTKKGTITIRIEPDSSRPEHLRIDVADTGIGIRPEEMERIFVPFLQANSRISRDHGGTGLGLSIVRSFVAMLGGSVHVSSVFGQGTTFSVVIPLNCPDDLAYRDPSPPDPRPLTTSPSALDAGLVLIIDDDVASRVLLRRQIEEAGLRASEASTGEDGLKMARSLMPAMLCLDVRLPGTEGWNILAELKSDPRTRNIKVIMTTVIEDRRLAATLGADDYLSKPVDRDALDRVLIRFRPDHQPGDVLIVEDEESLRHILARLVERNGWLPRQAEHGGVAMQMVNSKVPDLIFLDLMMPEVDGFEFLAWLRAHPSASTVPVVVVTAKELMEEDRIRLRGLVVDVVSKGGGDLREILSGFLKAGKGVKIND